MLTLDVLALLITVGESHQAAIWWCRVWASEGHALLLGRVLGALVALEMILTLE
jgi:hypothetical protein